ncbi:hypothetical protein HPP92_005116 [Vanilla planifolia]|uniref:Uncharacterized protein n=1 Tax=Vanilla planifolia TaxID=51239 RepID=A0A835RT91_VANPL|nr:hypothetical protein HPP92_005116 [Vanilla planifolia]
MEKEDANTDPSFLPAAVTVGFGLGFSILLFCGPSYPLVRAIKLADGVVKGVGAFRYVMRSPSPSPAALIFASKAVIKGFKVSKRLIPSTAAAPSTAATRKLSAFVGAANLLRYACLSPRTDGPLWLGYLRGGHKLSKNLMKVLETLLGLQLDSVLRRSINALGLLVKAAIVARVIENGIQSKHGCERIACLRCGVRWRCSKRLCFDGTLGHSRDYPLGTTGFGDHNVIAAKQMQVGVSELLSLSFPLELILLSPLQKT